MREEGEGGESERGGERGRNDRRKSEEPMRTEQCVGWTPGSAQLKERGGSTGRPGEYGR